MTEQELIRRFHCALTEIAALAEAVNELHWKQDFFDKAIRTLENEALPPESRLQSACRQTHVFGGMGSWIDSPPFSAAECGLAEAFEQRTSDLYEIRAAAMLHLKRHNRAANTQGN